MTNQALKEKAIFWANNFSLDQNIVCALITVESSWDTYAVRYESGWKWFLKPEFWARRVQVTDSTERVCQQMSWGLMQVMGAVARELGFDEDIPKLCDPDTGLKYGCMKLRQNIDRFGTTSAALAAYNAGSPNSKAGKAYAGKVIAAIRYTDS